MTIAQYENLLNPRIIFNKMADTVKF